MLGDALGQTRFLLARPRFAFLFALAGVVAASSAALSLARRWEDHRHLVTGRAQWIWLTHDVEEPSPLRFFAVRDFFWQGKAGAKATALLFVDRRYVFSFNGLRIGAGQQKPGDSLHVHDVSPLIRAGRNVVELEVESPDGAGGILFALELSGGQTVVSDRNWRVARSRRELSLGGRRAVIWGRPPMYPWGYPSLALLVSLRPVGAPANGSPHVAPASLGIWLCHRRSVRPKGLDRAPDPSTPLSLPQREAPPLDDFAETPRAAKED